MIVTITINMDGLDAEAEARGRSIGLIVEDVADDIRHLLLSRPTATTFIETRSGKSVGHWFVRNA